MDYSEILASILEMYAEELESSQAVQAIRKKVEKGITRYEDAEDLAREIGGILNDAFRRYLPEALTNGRLYREAADIVIRRPMLRGTQDVKDVTVRIQQGINKKNNLEWSAVVPEVNDDQLTGIITGICNANSYEAGKETLFDQTENFLEGYVDDFVQENADFGYRSGLNPTVERTVRANCCSWCADRAGTYNYEDVRDKGNEVWRRHKNCHCTITYSPGTADRSKSGKRDLTRWFENNSSETKGRKIKLGEENSFVYTRRRTNVFARRYLNHTENNLYIDKDVTLSPREIREINKQITLAKEAQGVVGICNAPFVITSKLFELATYNPRRDFFLIDKRLADLKNIERAQKDCVCPDDPRSTYVHELFHWKDAMEYKKKHGPIQDEDALDEFNKYSRAKDRKIINREGINSPEDALKLSEYAHQSYIDNDYDEVYTELRTKKLLKGGDRK